MGGGKETPRQKMVGMMYLVLTALLALNVSKSILDAFVAIEENTQKSAIVQLERGDGFVGALKQGIIENQKESPMKAAKCKYYLEVIDKIDKETAEMIEMIDKVKINILERSDEVVSTDGQAVKSDNGKNTVIDWNKVKEPEKKEDKDAVVWKKYSKKDGLRPSRLNLMAVQAKDQYDIPMHEIIGEEIAKPDPEKDGMKLWKMYNDYRSFLVETTGTLHDKVDSISGKGIGNPLHTVKTTRINDYKDNADLDKKVTAMLNKSNIFLKNTGNIKAHEDFPTLKQLYMELTKQEIFELVNDVPKVHWIGKTFDHSPLVAALASLSAMQLEILNARATAVGMLASKVVVAELSFNKLIALASISPSVANPGDPVELRVVMGAYDTDNQPIMEESGWTIENGMAIKKMSAPSADQTFTGTISIKTRTGGTKTESWETKIGVLTNEKTAAIETPDMQVFYEGIPIRLVAQATGMFKSVKMNVPSPYTAPKGSAGSTVNVTLTGTKADGTSASLGSKSFRVKIAPKPELLWNGVGTGQKAPKGSGGGLKCRYGNEVPFNPDFGQFQILSYYITFPGSKTPLEGVGSAISANHLSIIKGASGGVAIQVVVSGSYNGPVDATFK
jgi:hypothetical protein